MDPGSEVGMTIQTFCIITFLLQFPNCGYGFVKILQHIRRICFKIFPSPYPQFEDFATKIIMQKVL